MKDLMGDEFGCSEDYELRWKKEGNGVQEPLYKKLKTREILSRPNIEEKSGPLD